VRLEASTKSHVHQKIEIFWTNITSTMACPNFINGPKKRLGPLGVKKQSKVRAPIPLGYACFYTVCYKDIGEFQIL
jgi:hypothetical protein